MKDQEMVERIKKDLISKLQSEFGFCGVAEGDNNIMINSGNENIVITIKWETENNV